MSATPESAYTYYAFISYKHEDEKWAKWIQEKLETYRLPSVLQRENGRIPNRISPVFRDKTDITAGPLRQTLSKELEASRFLIVICSPRSAKSPYVDYEVEQFIRLGRQDRIIPFIIQGKVGASDPEQECYVPSLLQLEETLLGVNLPELGKRPAFLTVIAKMLDIRLDTLIGRDKIRRRKKKALIGAGIALVLSLGYLSWDYYIPKTRAYSDYVVRYGLPEGIFPLKRGFWPFSESEVEDRDDFYLITERKSDQSLILKHVNSAEVPIDYHTDVELADRPVIARYTYRVENGNRYAREARYMNRFEDVLTVLRYSDDATVVDFTGGDGSNAPVTLSSSVFDEGGMLDANNQKSKSAITRHIYTYDTKGFILSAAFMRDNRATVPTPDKNGTVGYACVTDNYGRIVEKALQYAFDDDSGGVLVHRITYRYATFLNQLVEVNYWDASGNWVLNSELYAAKLMTYNASGNLSDIRYYDKEGNACIFSRGYSSVHIEYDDHGFHLEEAFFDAKGSPVVNAEGYARVRFKSDPRGNNIKAALYGVDGKLMLAQPSNTLLYRSGFASIETHYGKDNRPGKVTYYGLDGKPALVDAGYSGLNLLYNDMGLVREISYFGPDGLPVKCREGFESFQKEYDSRGLVTKWRYTDHNGGLIETVWGYSMVESEFDANGNFKSSAFFDEKEAPVLNGEGYARQEWVYDDRGLLLSSRYLDTQGNPVDTVQGYAFYEAVFTEFGYCSWEAYYNKEENLVVVPSFGYAACRTNYSDQGYLTGQAFYGPDEKLMVNTLKGYARFTAAFNSRGQALEKAYYDADERLVVVPEAGWAKTTGEYDTEGRPLAEAFYGSDNELMMHTIFGYARAKASYDQWGNRFELAFYDEADRLYVSPPNGFARLRTEYDENRLLEQSYFDDEGSLLEAASAGFARYTQKWDEEGKLVEIAYYGEDGAPINGLFGFARTTYAYNEAGKVTQRLYFDFLDNPVEALESGYAQGVWEYKNGDELKREMYYNRLGSLLSQRDIKSRAFTYIGSLSLLEPAFEAGVRLNDLVLEYGSWSFFEHKKDDEGLSAFSAAVEEYRSKPKTLVVFRPSDGTIRRFNFDEKDMGIQFKNLTYYFSGQSELEAFLAPMKTP